MSDNKPDNQNDADTLSALMAAARQKVDSMSATAQTKYNEASAQAGDMMNAAKESFNQGMQKADQLMDSAKAQFNEGVQAAQQMANDTKAKFEAGVQSAREYVSDAQGKLQQGLADAKVQGQAMMESAKERVKNPGEADKQAYVEAAKKGAEVASEAMGQGAHALAGGYPGATGDAVKAWSTFQEGGGVPVAKMLAEQKLEDAGIRSTDATINKMAEPSKFKPDNEFNQLQKAVEKDAQLGKGPEDTKPEAKPQGVQDSKFVSDELKQKYMAREKEMGKDSSQAEARWDKANPKPPDNQPSDKPAVNASPGPATPSPSSPSASAPKPPSPQPKP